MYSRTLLEVLLYDILILGAGISGLSAAIYAAEQGLSVLILTKGAKPDGSSNYAQGGIAAVTSKKILLNCTLQTLQKQGLVFVKRSP